VYAGNVASAIVAAIDASPPAQPGFRAYNVTRDAPPALTQREFFGTFAEALGRRPRFVRVPAGLVGFGIAAWSTVLKTLFPGRYAGLGGAALAFILGENPYSTERIRTELGWTPPFDTRTAIGKSVGGH
jgi:nucleoside-diphosphate-sugar epimerase